MRIHSAHRYLFLAPLIVATLFGGVAGQPAQGAELSINTFDDDSSTAGFWLWWGGIEREVTWDSGKDAGGQASSGSAKLSVVYDNTNADNQYSIGFSLGGESAYNNALVAFPADYSAVEFDILWDTNTDVTVDQFNSSAGDAGFYFGLAGVVANVGGTPDWGGGAISWISPGPTLTGTGKWEHISVPLPVSLPGFAGLVFKKWQPTGPSGLNGPVTVWLDNIKLIKASAPPPAPTMSIQKNNTRGVQIFASASGQYQRQSIAATSAEAQAVSWIGNAEPVTYSLTIAEMPANPNFQVHLFLAPDSSGANSPDWNDPNVVFLDIRRNDDGTAQATFRFKTNAPNNNDMFYFQNGATVDGRLAVLSAPSALGTWSLRFQNDTNITLTGPGSTSTNFLMLPEYAASFLPTSSLTASFGVQPNQTDLIGQSATFSEFKIQSGAVTVLDDRFTTADPTQQVDPLLWARRMDDPNGIGILTADAAYIISWTVPDTGFQLQSKEDLKVGSWTELPLPATQIGVLKRTLIWSTNLPSLGRGYFRLVKTNSP